MSALALASAEDQRPSESGLLLLMRIWMLRKSLVSCAAAVAAGVVAAAVVVLQTNVQNVYEAQRS